MNKAIIRETDLRFSNLARRTSTKRIVIHHSGTVQDLDLSAAQIHQAHKAKGWAGIGYHFVIRKNGAIERGQMIPNSSLFCSIAAAIVRPTPIP